MRRRISLFIALLVLGGFFVLTLFQSISAVWVSQKESLVPIEGRAVTIIARNGVLEFENSDVYFLGPPQTGFFLKSAPLDDHQPRWMPGTYERKLDLAGLFQLRTTSGIRIPLWPFLAVLFVSWLFFGKKKRK